MDKIPVLFGEHIVDYIVNGLTLFIGCASANHIQLLCICSAIASSSPVIADKHEVCPMLRSI